MNENINVFDIHKNIIDNYKNFVGSFIHIKDKTINEKVEEAMESGKYWPEPLLAFNPSFQKGASLESLCAKDIIHPLTAEIFKDIKLYKHQEEAIVKASQGMDFIVTSGTGSGKSLTFLAS
ncbi:MAG: hypothetical protein GY757_37750, partial [bacterium]|nr:hypothetical protein [bacterium]